MLGGGISKVCPIGGGGTPSYNTFFVDVTRFLDGSRLRDGLRTLVYHRRIKRRCLDRF